MYSHQKYIKAYIDPHFSLTLGLVRLISVNCMPRNVNTIQWYMILICISQVTNEIVHLFVYLLVIYISSNLSILIIY